MPKYYRVRSQQEWDWLADKLNIYCVKSMACPVIIEHEQGQKDYRIVQYYGGFEPVIEVSQMMEESKMEDYVEVKDDDLLQVKNENDQFVFDSLSGSIYGNQIRIRKMYIPKSLLYPKVKFTEAEKAEFDLLKDKQPQTLRDVISCINEENSDYGTVSNLFNAIYEDKTLTELDFARAWVDESLIDVIPEKRWNVKVPISCGADYYRKDGGHVDVAIYASQDELLYDELQFTDEELKHYDLDKDIFEKVEVQNG